MNPASWLLAPLWPLQIFTSKKNIRSNPILGSERLNRRGLHVWRTRLAHRLAWRRRARLAHLIGEEDRRFFDRNGYVEKRSFLPDDVFRSLVTEVTALTAPANEMQEGDAVTRRIAVTPEVLARVPSLAALIDSPEWRGLTRYVSSFDTEPLLYIQTIFSHVDTSVEDPQTALHIDTFHPCMKAWFFLEDVAPDKGPFSYVPGSHRLTRWRLAWQKRKSVIASRPGGPKGGSYRVTEAELKRMRMPAPVRFAVPANTLIVGDTCGIHARTPSATPSVRIEIWADSRPSPFLPWTRPPGALVPGLDRHKTWLSVESMHVLGRLRLRPNAWHRVGEVTPHSPAVLPHTGARASIRKAA